MAMLVRKKKKNPGVHPISNIKKQPERKQAIYKPRSLSPNIYEITFMLTELFDYETSITHVFHKQMSHKEAKQSELYEKAHLVNCSQHI